jgi:hypothetical protein
MKRVAFTCAALLQCLSSLASAEILVLDCRADHFGLGFFSVH